MKDENDEESNKNKGSTSNKAKSFLKQSNTSPLKSASKLATALESEEFENNVSKNKNSLSLSNRYSDDFDDENKNENNVPKLSIDNNSTNSSTQLSSNFFKRFQFISSVLLHLFI